MTEYKHPIHLIAFDVPYPADYGGVIDIFYKVKALKGAGHDVFLHMYHYGRAKNPKYLKKYAAKLFFYERRTFRNPFIGSKPYIVRTRNGDELLNNLLLDRYPILFEGLHSTFHLDNPLLKDRVKIVRTHNIEHHYYKELEKSEIRYFKKYFFRIEAEKLRKYEAVLKHADVIAAISPADEAHFQKKYKKAMYLPAFHSNDQAKYPGKRGKFLLYHGNLAVPENYVAAMQLVKEVFSKLDMPCVVAGNNPPRELVLLCEEYSNVELRTHLNTRQIHRLIQDAHINVLHTNQNTGIKLKLLNALYQGKFAVVNPLMVEDTGLEDLCVIGNTMGAIRAKVEEFMLLDFTRDYFDHRSKVLDERFSNTSSIAKLIRVAGLQPAEPQRRSDAI